jgi:hypothetical protein
MLRAWPLQYRSDRHSARIDRAVDPGVRYGLAAGLRMAPSRDPVDAILNFLRVGARGGRYRAPNDLLLPAPLADRSAIYTRRSDALR